MEMIRSSTDKKITQRGLRTVLLTTALMIGSSIGYAQEKETASLIANCIECHGANGIGAEPDMPHLNGQPEPLLVTMLEAFREGKRPPKVRIHREIPAADVTPLAKYYSAQKATRPKSATNPDLVARGESIYLKRCADCHLDNGRDSDKEAPLMAAQSLEYLVSQTLIFKSGQRKFPHMMDDAYRGLSDEDLTATAHFFAAQDQVAPPVQQGRRRRR